MLFSTRTRPNGVDEGSFIGKVTSRILFQVVLQWRLDTYVMKFFVSNINFSISATFQTDFLGTEVMKFFAMEIHSDGSQYYVVDEY